jgi:hypothetical protein
MIDGWEIFEARLRSNLEGAGAFKPRGIETIIHRLRDQLTNFNDLRPFGDMEKGEPLSKSEIAARGFPARGKLSEQFAELFDVTLLNGQHPKALWQNAYMDAVFTVKRQLELRRMKSLGITSVRVLDPYQGVGGCGAKKRKKAYNVNEVPDLPLAGCAQEYCGCVLAAIVPGFG